MSSDSRDQSDITGSRSKQIPPEASQGASDDCADTPSKSSRPSATRGLIEVEFVAGARSGVETWNFDHEDQRQGFSEDWTPELREILERNQLISWKPSFPLLYPWSRECSKESARESYFKAGRDKFVTFKFSLKTDVIRIAQALRRLPEIDQAVSVPEIAPPHHMVAEPLGGNNNNDDTDCGPGGCQPSQWYLDRCDVPGAWEQQASGKGVVIADIDWGFDLTHPALLRTGLSKNVITNSPNVSDGNLLHHGNGVLGLAGADVSDEMAGIAFEATLWAIQAGTGVINRPVVEPEFWVGAINFVRSTPAPGRKVIILQVQTAGFSNIEMVPSIRKEIIDATVEQIVVCVPAGNGNRSGDAGLDDQGLPIPATDSIVVGATNYDPDINPFGDSNGGDRVVVYAPGDPDNDLTCGSTPTLYRLHFGGTSGATAKVAGVVALMLEKNDRLTPHEVREILGRSQKRVMDQGTLVGVLLDANQAVSEAIRIRRAARGRDPNHDHEFKTATNFAEPGPVPVNLAALILR
jgi:subtilisin family serine protease